MVLFECSTQARAASSAKPLGKVEFQHRANTICRSYIRKLEPLTRVELTRAVTQRWASLLAAQERELGRLTPPKTYAGRFRKMLGAGRPIPQLLLDWDEAVRSGDMKEAERTISELDRLADERTRLANTMHLSVCASQ